MNDNKGPSFDELAAQLKELIRRGGVARVKLLRGEETILNIPLNAGLAGAALGLTAPWTLVAAAAAALGFDCRILLVKTDGETVELLSRDKGRQAAAFGQNLARGLMDKLFGDSE